MPTPSRPLLLSIFLTIALSALAQPTIVNFDFGAVRITCTNGYAYEWSTGGCPYIHPMQSFNSSPGFGWTLSPNPHAQFGGAGLTGPGTIFFPPDFSGMPFNQAVLLQDRGSSVSQQVQGFSAGTYTLKFYLGSRYSSGVYDGNQTVQALVDGQVIGTWALASYTPFGLKVVSFTVGSGGNHTIEFTGTQSGDHTAFLSYVTITQAGH